MIGTRICHCSELLNKDCTVPFAEKRRRIPEGKGLLIKPGSSEGWNKGSMQRGKTRRHKIPAGQNKREGETDIIFLQGENTDSV